MKYWQVVTGLLVIWLLIIIYMSNSVFPNATDTGLRTERQLQRALEELDKLRNQNVELHSLATELRDLKYVGINTDKEEELNRLQEKLEKANKKLVKEFNQNTNRKTTLIKAASFSDGPSLDHEVARREVERVSGEFWLYIHSEVENLRNQATEPDRVRQLNKILANSMGYQRKLKNDLYKLTNDVDDMNEWRKEESRKLTDLVQRRIAYLQNPKDCGSAKKMMCNLGKGCGYGCQLHHVTYCLIMSYATQRTLILQSEGWRYAAKGWESVFLPLSTNCKTFKEENSGRWGNYKENEQIQTVILPIVDSLSPRPNYLPLSIPEDIADRIIRISGDPSAWWIGQFVTYLTRPNSLLQADIKETTEKLAFTNPIVGVHVRRTDKLGMEAQFHALAEYMTHVNEWFDTYEKRHPGVQRRVYLATDDPNVLNEAKTNYENYIFVSDNEISKTAGLGSRYSDASLRGIIIDIYFLSRCDFLVCTFSSQVCRVAYEMMQPLHGDASHYFKSLDDIYYYGGQNAHNWQAIENHEPESGEIHMNIGDTIGVAGNHWNGYSKGKNQKSGAMGLFPSYKAVNKVVRVKMPTYPEVPEL